MHWYVTYNEPPNGLYESQVVEVTNFIEGDIGMPVQLIAFVSIRGFAATRKQVKALSPDAIVLPCAPGFLFIRWHFLFLIPYLLLSRPRKVVCRGSFATLIASPLRKLMRFKLTMDARALMYEEEVAYGIFPPRISGDIRQIEIDSLRTADQVTAVTAEMYDYWEAEFKLDFHDSKLVIPCTVTDKLLREVDSAKVEAFKRELGYSDTDIVLIYSGSTAAWQSLDRLTDWLRKMMQQQPELKALFLSKPEANIQALMEEFPDRVQNRFVKHAEVPIYLSCADYGLMLRTYSRANSVGSPIKTAEYLLAGLGVITNRNMAVYRLIESERVGLVVNDFDLLGEPIPKPSRDVRLANREKGELHFSKHSKEIRAKYAELYA